MSDHLTADQDKKLKGEINERLSKVHGQRYARRDLSHLVEGTGNYEVRKGDCERAVATLHRTGDTGMSRQIRKIVTARDNDAAAMVAEMHRHPEAFEGRTIQDHAQLVLKLSAAVIELIKRDFASAKDAKKALRKMIGGED